MTPEDVSEVINKLVGFILSYAVTLAAISTLSMALIEMFKALCSWRDRFHKERLLTWIRSVPKEDSVDRLEDWPSDSEWTPPQDVSEFCRRVYEQLLQLTTGETPDQASMKSDIEWTPWNVSAANALFALALDKMMGQIQDAADTAMSNPGLYFSRSGTGRGQSTPALSEWPLGLTAQIAATWATPERSSLLIVSNVPKRDVLLGESTGVYLLTNVLV